MPPDTGMYRSERVQNFKISRLTKPTRPNTREIDSWFVLEVIDRFGCCILQLGLGLGLGLELELELELGLGLGLGLWLGILIPLEIVKLIVGFFFIAGMPDLQTKGSSRFQDNQDCQTCKRREEKKGSLCQYLYIYVSIYIYIYIYVSIYICISIYIYIYIYIYINMAYYIPIRSTRTMMTMMHAHVSTCKYM